MWLSIRTKILLLMLALTLPSLVAAGGLAVSSLQEARDLAVDQGSSALYTQVSAALESRVRDKAALYNSQLAAVQQQVDSVRRSAALALTAGLAAPPADRVWVAPDGPTVNARRRYTTSIVQARRFIPLLRSLVDSNPLVELGYIGLERGGVVAFSDDSVVDTLLTARPFDPRARPWYLDAQIANATVWTDTYVDANTKKLITTCATPIYDQQGAFIGVVGFDLLLDRIQTDLLTVDIGEGGFAFLLDESGQMLVGPGQDLTEERDEQARTFLPVDMLQAENSELRAVAGQMTSRETGVTELVYEGQSMLIAFAPIDTAGWSVGLMVSREAVIGTPIAGIASGIDDGQNALRQQLVGLLLVLAVLVSVVGGVLALSFTRPIEALQTGARLVAGGQLEHTLPPAGHDEIGELVKLFNMMTVALRAKVAQMQHNAHQLLMINAVSNEFKSLLDEQQLYSAIPQAVCEHFSFKRCSLYLIKNDELRVVAASFGTDQEARAQHFMQVANARRLKLSENTTEAATIRGGRPIVVDDPWHDPRVDRAKQEASESLTYAQVPIFGDERQVIGLLSADHDDSPQVATDRELDHLQMFATMVGLTIEHVWLYSNLERQVSERTAELRTALERAQLADQRKSGFLRSVSHELRTPLNAIIGFSNVLLDDTDEPLTALQRDDVERINRNGSELLTLINELLDLARIEAGYMDIAHAPMQLRPLIMEALATSSTLERRKHVGLKLDVPPDIPPVYADRNRTRQVLLNLLSNAVKFTDEGSVTISARVVPAATTPHGSAATEDVVRVAVRDTGIGIAPDEQARIFDEFRQAHGQRSRAYGTGLGLAIVQRLVQAQGGTIWLESTLGEGSTFMFTLPLCPDSLPDTPPDASLATDIPAG